MLIGQKFVILTDSKSLTQNLNIEKQNGIVARWIIDLQEFDYSFEFIQGSINPADYISRNLNNIDSQNIQDNLFAINDNLKNEKIKEEQNKDEKLSKIIQAISKGKLNKTTKKFKLNKDGILILAQNKNNNHAELIIAPDSLKNTIIEEAHRPHFGFPKTYHTVKMRFFWYGMFQSILKYTANCISCNRAKQHKTIKIPIKKMEKDFPVGSVLICDLVGKLPLSLNKNSFIVTILDANSRYLEAVPVKNVETATILNVFNNYFSTFGLARTVHVDNGSQFKSKTFKQYFKKLGIEIKYGSVYFPHSQALVERSHNTLKSSLMAMSKETFEWCTRLLYFKLAYNTSIHRATNYTPSMIFFAREIRNTFTTHIEQTEVDLTNYVKNRLQHMTEVRKLSLEAQHKMFKEYDKINQGKKNVTLNLGQIVYMKEFKKPRSLQNRYSGPFQILKILRNENVLLQHMQDTDKPVIKRHISHLYTPKNLSLNNSQD